MTPPFTATRLRRAQRKLERLKQRGDVAGLVEAFVAGDWFASSALVDLAREGREDDASPGASVVPMLAILVRDPDQDVATRARGLDLLADTGDTSALAPMLAVLGDTRRVDPEDPGTALSAASVRALRRLGDPRAIDALLGLLVVDVRAADATTRRWLGEILWSLVALANGGLGPVGRLADRHAVDGLVAVLLAIGVTDAQDQALERLQADAVAALERLAGTGDEAALDALRALWDCELDGLWWRRLVLEALVRQGDEEAVAAAARALQRWVGGERPSDANLSLARALADTGDGWGRRALVVRLLARLEHAADCHDRRAAISDLYALRRVEPLVPLEGREVIATAARDPLFFSSGRVFDDDELYALDDAEEQRARHAARELFARLRALERRSERELLL